MFFILPETGLIYHSNMKILIAGCGYIGTALGAELSKRGFQVYGLTRSAAAEARLKAAGIYPLIGDITDSETLARLPVPFDWIVNCAASSASSIEDYRRVYLQGMRNLISWSAATPPRKFVYTSSTSVYGQQDGSLIVESSPTEPEAETAKILVETEQALLDAARRNDFPGVILRVAGIYGPGRGHLFKQYLRNEAAIEGTGERIINMIHVDDVVGALLAALERGRPGEVYNAADNEPVSQLAYFQWLSVVLGKELPPVVSQAPESARKRGLSHKRVQNGRLKQELGYMLKYPTFRDGYKEEILRLVRAGELSLRSESAWLNESPADFR
jgi:nucleoside-diphosphate-sugar epimerase